MVGGVKVLYAVLLALVLIVGGAKVLSGHASADMPTRVHDHPQPPPLLEMLPPIGPVGIVLMGVAPIWGLRRRSLLNKPASFLQSTTAHGPAPDGHHHEGEGGREDNEEQIQLPHIL